VPIPFPHDISLLLVDSSATDRYYFAILLKRLEFNVLVSESSEEALKLMQEHSPSAVLMDSAFPDANRAEILRAVTAPGRNRNIPVIILADRDDQQLKKDCLEAGCSEHLVRPVEPGLLYRTILKTLTSTPREHIRIAIPLKVVIGDGTSHGGVERTEYTTTISEGGLYLRTLFPWPKKSSAPVKIFIHNRAIRATAEVIYNRPMTGGVFREPGMGMKFTDISQNDRKIVRHFIKEHLTSDIFIGL